MTRSLTAAEIARAVRVADAEGAGEARIGGVG